MAKVSTANLSERQRINLAVLVAALGYFVDVYDLVLFSVLRVDSLKSLGFAGDELMSNGVLLLNFQMTGFLLGGILWGILGDKVGRIQVLFGSILLYSLANIANAAVSSIDQYLILRLLAGIGLAGEIGAGITLVSELMPKEKRGYGTTIVATVGVFGAVVAALVGDFLPWRYAYVVGGVMGLILLFLRVSVSESGIFSSVKQNEKILRGSLRCLFSSSDKIKRYLAGIAVGTPVWFLVGILVTFSPEIGIALGIAEPLKAGKGILYSYIGFTVGDLVSGLLSQYLRSRKKVIGGFLIMTCAITLCVLNTRGLSAEKFYYALAALGFFGGYWAVFLTTAAEQFGTNLRATVATTTPNFVRGMTVPMAFMFNQLKGEVGVVLSAEIVCVAISLMALVAVFKMRETFGVDLNFTET